MPTYTFHHYDRSMTVSSKITFVDCADDRAALDEAQHILEREALSCVEVCEMRREVGTVRWDRDRGQVEFRLARVV